MRERVPSELEIAAAFEAFLQDAPTEVQPAKLADDLARTHPHRRVVIGGWGFGLTPSIAWIVLIAGLLLALVLGGLIAGAGRPAVVGTTGTVSITIDGLAGVEGEQVAAIVRGVGGFKVVIDADPFSVTHTIRDGSPLMRADRWAEHELAEVAQVPAGTFPMEIWVAERLGPYSEWTPAAPISMYCEMKLTVVRGQHTEVRVTGLTMATNDGMVPPDDIDTTCETD